MAAVHAAYASLAADVPVPLSQSLGFAGLDHRISSTQSLKAKFAYERYRLENFRVGGISDESWGQDLNRDNWNVSFEHTMLPMATLANLGMTANARANERNGLVSARPSPSVSLQ